MTQSLEINFVLEKVTKLIDTGNFREGYDILRVIQNRKNQYPAWYLLAAKSLLGMHAYSAGFSLLAQYLELNPEDGVTRTVYESLLDFRSAPLERIPFQEYNQENILSFDDISTKYPERVSDTLKLNAATDKVILYNANIIRPYGLIGWSDGIIVKESTNSIDFVDASYSYLMVGESNDPAPFPVHMALSLTSGPDDECEESWNKNQEWKIKTAIHQGYRGVFIAPIHLDYVAKTLSSCDVHPEQIIGSEEKTIIADQVIVYQKRSLV